MLHAALVLSAKDVWELHPPPALPKAFPGVRGSCAANAPKMPREMLAQAAPRFCPRYVAADCQSFSFSCGIFVELCQRCPDETRSEASCSGEEAQSVDCNESSGWLLSVSGSGLARHAACEAHETLRPFLPHWPGRQPLMAPAFLKRDAHSTGQAQEPSQQPKDASHEFCRLHPTGPKESQSHSVPSTASFATAIFALSRERRLSSGRRRSKVLATFESLKHPAVR